MARKKKLTVLHRTLLSRASKHPSRSVVPKFHDEAEACRILASWGYLKELADGYEATQSGLEHAWGGKL
jgi:hypothetical protein